RIDSSNDLQCTSRFHCASAAQVTSVKVAVTTHQNSVLIIIPPCDCSAPGDVSSITEFMRAAILLEARRHDDSAAGGLECSTSALALSEKHGQKGSSFSRSSAAECC